MTAPGDEVSFAAHLDSVGAAAAFVTAFCERWEVETGDALRVAIVVEELVLNIVTHGYGDAPGGTIRLTLACDEVGVTVACEDGARPYDPRLAFEEAPPDLDAPVETRGVGGLGQWIVGHLAEVVRYERAGDVNRLVLRVRRGR